MRWPLVPGDLAGLVEVGNFFFQGIEAALQPGDILLLPEKLFVELTDGFILHGCKGFELDDAFLHGDRLADPAGRGERLMGFCIEASGGLT